MKENVWYPLSRPDDERVQIQRAEGIYLYDSRDKEYMDANSGLWNVPLGYSNQAIQDKIIEQMKKVSYVNACEFGTDIGLELAEQLIKLHHDEIDKIIYTCTGSESVELTMKLFRRYASFSRKPEKNGIAIIRNSYHGSYYGSMSLSDYDGSERNGYGPLLGKIYELSMPFATYMQMGSDEENEEFFKAQLDYELEQLKDKIIGIILEPVLGSAGVFPLPAWFIKKIMDFSKENEILTAFDEVATGFGRTGKMFCYQKYNVKPDIVIMSKGINNGVLPMGAVAVGRKITDRFREKDQFIFHLSTQNGNALSCAAALATISELTKNDGECLKYLDKKNAYFLKKFNTELASRIPGIKGIRDAGMMFAIELQDKDEKQLPFSQLLKIVELTKKNGVIAEWSYIENVTSCLVLFLPFIIQGEEIDKLIMLLSKSIKRILR